MGPDAPAGDGGTQEDLRAELAAAQERFLRARADLDNYRKRADRDLERRVREEVDRMLLAWLEVVDSVDRALAWEGDGAEEARLRTVREQIDGVLARQGIRRLGEPGEQFDPELHEAIAVVPASDREPGTIADVARPGYAAGDRVLRPAQVIVVAPPAGGG